MARRRQRAALLRTYEGGGGSGKEGGADGRGWAVAGGAAYMVLMKAAAAAGVAMKLGRHPLVRLCARQKLYEPSAPAEILTYTCGHARIHTPLHDCTFAGRCMPAFRRRLRACMHIRRSLPACLHV
eukprot:354414-Chlamydomonas_euryale.AAC.4